MKGINTKYKILALIPLVALGGCQKQEQEHKNVVSGVLTINNRKLLFLNDVETDQNRVYEFSNRQESPLFEYMRPDDTVKIITGGAYSGDAYYKDNVILYEDAVGLECNIDSILARQQREQLKQNTR